MLEISNVQCGWRQLLPSSLEEKKKKVHLFSLEGKLKWHISMTATNNFVLFLFHFSCAHMKCEIIVLNILASLAEQLTVASFITYYLTDASNTESVNLIMVLYYYGVLIKLFKVHSSKVSNLLLL